MSHVARESAISYEDQLKLHRAAPVTVNLYGIKELTLPGYLLLLLSSVVLAVLLVGLAHEVVTPRTSLGFELERLVSSEDEAVREDILTVAIWTPTAMLVCLAFELIEGVIVLSMFRRKMTEQSSSMR